MLSPIERRSSLVNWSSRPHAVAYVRSQPLRQPPLPRPVAGTALGRLPESLWPRCVDSACDRSHLPAPIRLPRGAEPALGRSVAEPASEGFDLHFRLSQPTTRWCAVFRSSSPPS